MLHRLRFSLPSLEEAFYSLMVMIKTRWVERPTR